MRVSAAFQSKLSLVNDNFTPIKGTQKGRKNKWNPAPSDENPGGQEAHHCISIRDRLRANLLKKQNEKWDSKKVIAVNKATATLLSEPTELAKHYSDEIQHHVALRTALFFQQAIACFNTPFHYEISSTEGQYFTAPTLKTMTKSGKKITVKYQAAHSSTTPALKACSRTAYKKQKTTGIVPKYFTFLAKAQQDDYNNSTVGLPIFVNQMDTLIDGTSKSPGLRAKTIELINQVAEARIDPVKATRLFLKAFKEMLETRPTKSKSMTPEKWEVIKIYKEQVSKMIELAAKTIKIKGRHPFFDSLLDINVAREAPSDIPQIRKIVYERKFEIIRETQFTSGKILRIIQKHFPKSNQDKLHLVKMALIYAAKDDQKLQTAFQKLFCISYDALKKNKELHKIVVEKFSLNKKDYQAVIKEITEVIDNYKKLEQYFKAALLKKFRLMREMSQDELSKKMKIIVNREIRQELSKKKPSKIKLNNLRQINLSRTTISKFERAIVPITVETARIVTQALKIQPGHFFCAFFGSVDTI